MTAGIVALLLKVSAILTVAALSASMLRNSSAARRHFVWSAAMTSIIVLVVLQLVVPPIVVPVASESPFAVIAHAATDELATPALTSASASIRVAKPMEVVSQSPRATEFSSSNDLSSQSVRGDETSNSLVLIPNEIDADEAALSTSSNVHTLDIGLAKQNANALVFWNAETFTRRNIRQFFLAVWFTGSLLLLLRLGYAHRQLRRIVNASRAVSEAGLRDDVRRIASTLGIDRPVRLLVHPRINTPCTAGWTDPVILLPANRTDWNAARQRAVITHELAHVSRNDSVSQSVASIACAFFWFHPGFWIAARLLRAESERAADDCVINSGMSPVEYADHLLAIANRSSPSMRFPTAAVGMARTSQLETRMRAMLNVEQSRTAITRSVQRTFGIVSLMLVIPFAGLQARVQEPQPKKQQPQLVPAKKPPAVVPQTVKEPALPAAHKLDASTSVPPVVVQKARAPLGEPPMVIEKQAAPKASPPVVMPKHGAITTKPPKYLPDTDARWFEKSHDDTAINKKTLAVQAVDDLSLEKPSTTKSKQNPLGALEDDYRLAEKSHASPMIKRKPTGVPDELPRWKEQSFASAPTKKYWSDLSNDDRFWGEKRAAAPAPPKHPPELLEDESVAVDSVFDRTVSVNNNAILSINIQSAGDLSFHVSDAANVRIRAMLPGIDAQNLRVSLERTSNGAEIAVSRNVSSNRSMRRAHYEIWLPANMSVYVLPANDAVIGQIKVSDIKGATGINNIEIDGKLSAFCGTAVVAHIVGGLRGNLACGPYIFPEDRYANVKVLVNGTEQPPRFRSLAENEFSKQNYEKRFWSALPSGDYAMDSLVVASGTYTVRFPPNGAPSPVTLRRKSSPTSPKRKSAMPTAKIESNRGGQTQPRSLSSAQRSVTRTNQQAIEARRQVVLQQTQLDHAISQLASINRQMLEARRQKSINGSASRSLRLQLRPAVPQRNRPIENKPLSS